VNATKTVDKMMPDSPFQSHSIGGFASTSQHHAHLRSISFDQAYLPPTPPPKNGQSFEHADGYSIPAARSEGVQDLYPIVAWTFEPDSSQSRDFPEEEDSASSIATPTKETILDRARANSKCLKRKLSSLALKKQASCSRLRETREFPDLDLHPVPPLPLGIELDPLNRHGDLYDSPPSTSSSWS
jgi:hypothetical protein